MAYSDIENRFLNSLAELQFPTATPQEMAAEPSLEGMQLAAGPSATRTDAGPRFGRGGVTKAQSQTAGGLEKPLTALADTGAGFARGAVAQTLGIGGDLESLYNGLKAVFNRPEDQGRLDAFIAGMEANTTLPTTEDISKKLPPVVPAGAADAKSREASANVGQSFGQLAPLPGAIEAGVAGGKAAAKALGPTAANMMEQGLRKSGMIMDVAPAGPRVDSIDRFPVGPSSIKPRVIAPDASLYREMSADNLTDFLREDKQFSYAPVFVTDNADLAIGQGSNVGVKVTFRANSVSGEEHRKPMTGGIAGREYKADVFAPQAIESITFASESDLKKIKSIAARVLQSDFERVTDGKKDIVFVRKAQDKEKK